MITGDEGFVTGFIFAWICIAIILHLWKGK